MKISFSTIRIIWPQVTNFWNNVLNEAEKTRLVNNIAGHLKDAKEFLQKRAVRLFVHICINNYLLTKSKVHTEKFQTKSLPC